MMAAFMLWRQVSDEKYADQLTDYAKIITHPEHDLQIFVAGLFFTMVAGLATVAWWKTLWRGIPAAQLAEFLTRLALWQGGLAVASMIGFIWLLCSYWFSHDFLRSAAVRQSGGWPDDVRLILPALLAVICLVMNPRFGSPPAVGSLERAEARRRLVNKALSFAIPLLIVLAVGVAPGLWPQVAGQFMLGDRCHHLNFFAVGPALAFDPGKAFGTDIYSQYGIGWPLILSKLSNASMGSYGTFVGMEVVVGCVYFVVVFFFLRLWLKQEIWAAIGVLLALYWQIFTGIGKVEMIWMYPSSTMMRHPMDVFFFLALMLNQRAGKKSWVVLAGIACGLGIFFETETGVYLLVTFAVFWTLLFLLARGSGKALGTKGLLVSLVIFYSAALATLLPLLFYASRGTLFSKGFFQGWLESLVKYGAWGVGALPVSTSPEMPLLFFMAMVALYVTVIGYAVIRCFHRDAGHDEILLATISAYGLAMLLLFVGRSHPYTLCHAAVPFALVFTALLFRCWRALERWLPNSWFAEVLCGGLVLLLLTNAQFFFYPSLLKACFVNAPPDGLSLTVNPKDISGLPVEAGSFVNNFRSAAAAIRSQATNGSNVAIFDVDDTLLYYAAGIAPWSHYASLFHMLLTKESLADVERELDEQPPACVVIQGEFASRLKQFEFAWAPLHQHVKSRYQLYQTIGEYEIWRLGTPVK